MTTPHLPRVAAATALTAMVMPSSLVFAERMYGAGAPFTTDQLPPGQLRSRLESLPAPAQAKAMHWLHGFVFPEADVDALQVDDEGGVFYVDTETPTAPAGSSGGAGEGEPITAAEAFSLHSKPGASKVIFIDVDGHVITGTAWNSGRADPLYAKAYDTDGDPNSFSAAELDAIAEIWHRVAEDFAAFDVDVTTEEPASFGPTTGRMLVTDDTDEFGNAMPSQGAGGVAYVNVFGASYYGYYSPALVYADNLGPDFPPYIAEAGSHEMGHNLGLSHDGYNGGGYYSGHGSGWVSWGPIMGTGYNDNVSQWSQGEYSGANNTQDDIAIMAGKLAQRSDDHGDSASTASLLVVGGDGSVVATNPESDPFNVNPQNKGIVETRTDVDMFLFSTGGGTVDLTVTPSWAAYPRSSGGRGTNLDVEATLYDLGGSVVASSDPLDNTDARVTTVVVAGDYYLAVTGVGNSVSPYSDYGSQGQYFISGSVPTANPDVTAPTPDPMSWASSPSAAGPYSMAMTASVAADDSGGAVQYLFDCVSGGGGCAASGWQSSTSHTATGLDPDTSYSWRVMARDLAGNETSYSTIAAATTDLEPQPPAAPSAVLASDTGNGEASVSWADNSDDESGFEVVRESWHSKRNRWQSSALVASPGENTTAITDASGGGTFRYKVRAVNAVGASAYSAWAEVTVAGGDKGGKGGGGGDGGCKGGPKKCP